MKYLKSKPGSLEASAGQVSGFATEQEYQKLFKKELDKAGKGIASMSDQEKKSFFNKIDKMYKAKNEEVQESASQVQVKRDGKGNFNLMLRGKEIGYYHKSGSKYMVYYDKDGDDYDQSDEVSSEMQAKKLAYDNMNEVKVDELTKAQEKLPPALQKAIKDKEMKEEDAYDNDRFIIKNGKATVDNSNTADSKDHVHAPNAKIALQLHKQGKKVYKEDLGKEDDSIVKAVVGQLKKAVKAHDSQAKDLEKAMKTEADQHGDEINQHKKDAMKKGEKEPKKLNADTGTKMTKVETEPSVDYKN